MRNLLYIIAIVLIVAWVVGFFGFSLGYLIHLLLAIALISIILGVIRNKRY